VPDRENSDATGMVWICVDSPTSIPGDACDPGCENGQACRPSFGASTGVVWTCVDRPTARTTRDPTATRTRTRTLSAPTTPEIATTDATTPTVEEEVTTPLAQLTTIDPEDGCPR